jgi:hypothetical protein
MAVFSFFLFFFFGGNSLEDWLSQPDLRMTNLLVSRCELKSGASRVARSVAVLRLALFRRFRFFLADRCSTYWKPARTSR